MAIDTDTHAGHYLYLWPTCNHLVPVTYIVFRKCTNITIMIEFSFSCSLLSLLNRGSCGRDVSLFSIWERWHISAVKVLNTQIQSTSLVFILPGLTTVIIFIIFSFSCSLLSHLNRGSCSVHGLLLSIWQRTHQYNEIVIKSQSISSSSSSSCFLLVKVLPLKMGACGGLV